jgi:hypothetical protein
VLDVYAFPCVNTGRKGINPTNKPLKIMQFIKRNWDDISLAIQVTPALIGMGLVVKFVIFAYSYTH